MSLEIPTTETESGNIKIEFESIVGSTSVIFVFDDPDEIENILPKESCDSPDFLCGKYSLSSEGMKSMIELFFGNLDDEWINSTSSWTKNFKDEEHYIGNHRVSMRNGTKVVEEDLDVKNEQLRIMLDFLDNRDLTQEVMILNTRFFFFNKSL